MCLVMAKVFCVHFGLEKYRFKKLVLSFSDNNGNQFYIFLDYGTSKYQITFYVRLFLLSKSF